MAKRKRKKKRGFPLFYTIYWVLVVAALGGIAYGLTYLWDVCRDYEAVQPKYVAAPYEELYASEDISRICELSGGVPLYEFETQADYEQFVSDWIGEREVSVNAAYSPDDSVKRYIAKAGGERFSEFTLRKTGEKSKLGFDQWEFDALTLDIAVPETTYTCKVFSDYTVSVNGTALSDSYLTETDIPTFSTGHLPSNVYNPSFKVYTFKARFGQPEIEAVNEKGELGILLPDEGSETGWHMDFTYSQSAKERMNDYVLKVARALSLFISEDGTRAGVLQYVMDNSRMESFIKAYDNDWFTPHSKFSITNAITYDYFVYAENCFSCVAQYSFNISSSAGRTSKSPVCYRFYFAKVGDEWLVFDYENAEFNYELHEQTKAE